MAGTMDGREVAGAELLFYFVPSDTEMEAIRGETQLLMLPTAIHDLCRAK